MTDSSLADTSETQPKQRRCLNCNEPMQGAFCGICGQLEKEVRRPVIYFLQEFLRVVFELDGRVYRTLLFLLTQPGYLTKEYFAGRRMKYTPPLRLFLVVSIGFFLLVTVFNTFQNLRIAMQGSSDGSEVVTTVSSDGAEDFLISEGMTDEQFEENFGDTINFFASMEIPFLSEESNSNLQIALSSQLRANPQEVVADPREFFMGSLEYITFFMLLMMPILALIQQILWILSRRYFVEHLILTVHNHTFIILMIFVAIVLGAIDDLAVPVLSTIADGLGVVAVLWIFVYLYLSLRRYFGAGWFVTAILYLTTTAVYVSVLSSGLFVFAMLLVLLA